jgi:hypothetical protein
MSRPRRPESSTKPLWKIQHSKIDETAPTYDVFRRCEGKFLYTLCLGIRRSVSDARSSHFILGEKASQGFVEGKLARFRRQLGRGIENSITASAGIRTLVTLSHDWAILTYK